MWNSSGFYVIERFPNDTKMNSDYFVTNMLILLEYAIFHRGRASHQKRLVVLLDNCSVHTSRASTDWLEEYVMHGMPHQPTHPPYSPNLTPNDFYLFPTVKEKLELTQVADEDQFCQSLPAILRGVDQEELNRVFQACVGRVQEASEGNGGYVG
jgi:histone-lysine N-methyltransferase SETMAR